MLILRWFCTGTALFLYSYSDGTGLARVLHQSSDGTPRVQSHSNPRAERPFQTSRRSRVTPEADPRQLPPTSRAAAVACPRADASPAKAIRLSYNGAAMHIAHHAQPPGTSSHASAWQTQRSGRRRFKCVCPDTHLYAPSWQNAYAQRSKVDFVPPSKVAQVWSKLDRCAPKFAELGPNVARPKSDRMRLNSV